MQADMLLRTRLAIKVNSAFSQCLADIRKLDCPQARVAELRTDGGLEYKTDEMKFLLDREGITHSVRAIYTRTQWSV